MILKKKFRYDIFVTKMSEELKKKKKNQNKNPCTYQITQPPLEVNCYFFSKDLIFAITNTVEPRSTDTRLIRTPGYYGQFRLSRRKSYIFSPK